MRASKRHPHGEFEAPPGRTIRVSVWGTDGLLPAAAGQLRLDDVPTTTLVGVNVGGRLAFDTTATGGEAWLTVTAPDYEERRVRVSLAQDNHDVDLVPSRRVIQLPALRVNGQFFETVDGQPYTGISASCFDLFEHHATGRDIDPVVDELVTLGFTEARVFLAQHGGLGTFDPRPHLDTLPAFCARVGARGLRLELTIFPDVKRWCPDPAEQRRILHLVEERVLPFAAFVQIEGMNEGDYLANGADGILEETLDPRLLWSLGSRLVDGGTMKPTKTHGTSHPSRTKDWPRKVGHGAYEDVAAKLNIPCKANECKRPDEDGYQMQNYFDAAANGALLTASATFHSQEGKASQLLQDNTHQCAVAWVAGAKAVPLAYQRGRYTAGHLHDSPMVHKDEWSSRTHCRIVGNRACCSVPQRKADWRAEGRNGWRVTKETSSVVELAR